MEYKVEGGALRRGVEKRRLRSKESKIQKIRVMESGSSSELQRARPQAQMWDHLTVPLVSIDRLKITISRNIVVETCSLAFSVVFI